MFEELSFEVRSQDMDLRLCCESGELVSNERKMEAQTFDRHPGLQNRVNEGETTGSVDDE